MRNECERGKTQSGETASSVRFALSAARVAAISCTLLAAAGDPTALASHNRGY